MYQISFLIERPPAKTYYITLRGSGPAWRLENHGSNYYLYSGRKILGITCDLVSLLNLDNLRGDMGLQRRLLAAALKLKDNQKVKVVYRQSS